MPFPKPSDFGIDPSWVSSPGQLISKLPPRQTELIKDRVHFYNEAVIDYKTEKLKALLERTIGKDMDIDIKQPVNQAESAIVDPQVKATADAAVESDKKSSRSFHSQPNAPNMATQSDNSPLAVPSNGNTAYAPFTEVKADDLATVGRDWIKSLENWDWNRYSQSKTRNPSPKPQTLVEKFPSKPRPHRPLLQSSKKPEAPTRRVLVENFSDFQMSHCRKREEQVAQGDGSSSRNLYKRRFQSSSQDKSSSMTPKTPHQVEATTAKTRTQTPSSVQLNGSSGPAAGLIDETGECAGPSTSNTDHYSASKGNTTHHPTFETPNSHTSKTIEPPHHDLLRSEDHEEHKEKAKSGAAEDLAGLLFTSVPQTQSPISPEPPVDHPDGHGLAGLLFETAPSAVEDTRAPSAVEDTSTITASEQYYDAAEQHHDASEQQYDENLWVGLDDSFGTRVAAPSSAEKAQHNKTSLELIDFDLGDEGRETHGKSVVEDPPTKGVSISPHMRGVQPETPAAPAPAALMTQNPMLGQPRSNSGTKSSNQQRGLVSVAQTSRSAIDGLPTAEELAGRVPVNIRLYTTKANSPVTLIDVMEQSAREATGKTITPNDFEFW